jgi:catalase
VSTLFRLINEAGESCVNSIWKPKLGTHAVAWDEAQKFQERIPIFTERIYGKQLKLEFSGMGIRCTK